jgi:hypothetical protein
LREALASLDADREFLKAGGVFSDDQIDAYIELKMEENMRYEMTPHPVEFDMYYSNTNTRSDTPSSDQDKRPGLLLLPAGPVFSFADQVPAHFPFTQS